MDSRRALRLRLRAPAVVTFGRGRHEVVTEDFGADGCRFVSTFPLRRGEAVYVTVFLPAPAGDLSMTATVAWASSTPPFQTGVEFARSGGGERARRVRALAGKDPALAQPPAPLRPTTRLRLGAEPRPGAVLGRDELAVLRAARDGAHAAAILADAGSRHREVRTAIATLLARGLLLDGFAAAHGPGWRTLLDDDGVPVPPPFAPVERNPFVVLRTRPLRALAYLEAARAEGALGHLAAAVEWLQAALTVAPDDREIADALDSLTTAESREVVFRKT